MALYEVLISYLFYPWCHGVGLGETLGGSQSVELSGDSNPLRIVVVEGEIVSEDDVHVPRVEGDAVPLHANFDDESL